MLVKNNEPCSMENLKKLCVCETANDCCDTKITRCIANNCAIAKTENCPII